MNTKRVRIHCNVCIAKRRSVAKYERLLLGQVAKSALLYHRWGLDPAFICRVVFYVLCGKHCRHGDSAAFWGTCIPDGDGTASETFAFHGHIYG
jgi:hypothetical protein